MELDIVVKTNRNTSVCIDINEPLENYFSIMDKYSFQFSIHIFGKAKLAAEVVGIALDERKIKSDGLIMKDLADGYSRDAYLAINSLVRSNMYTKELDDDIANACLCTCYIDRVYVEPSHRNKGIGKYVFNNLRSILSLSLNLQTRYFVIYPFPEQPYKNKNNRIEWIQTPDRGGSNKKLMIDVLTKAGYERIGKTRFFALNCTISPKTLN